MIYVWLHVVSGMIKLMAINGNKEHEKP